MEPEAGAVVAAPRCGDRREPVPVTVIAGFLGAGKTTLLNRILAGRHGVRVAVVVNDFGSIDVDSRLVVDRDATTITLDNGCICCSTAGDLVGRLTGLLESDRVPEHVLIETSGVSDPGRILVALRDRHLRTLARVDGVITLVDARGAGEIPPGHLELARRQLAAADVIVFNKIDLVSGPELQALHERLTYPRARVVDAVDAGVPLELVLGVDRGDDPDPPRVARHATEGFSTWAWTSTRPLALDAVRAVLSSLPPAVYRAKGFLHLAERPDVRAVAHVVGRRVEIRNGGAWEGEAPRSELVFVSLASSIDAVGLRRRLSGTAAVGAALGDEKRDDAN